MSRTYRRKNSKAKYRAFETLAEYTVEHVRVPGGYWCIYISVPLDPSTKEYAVKRSEYYRDKTHKFKEPGPGYFRRLFYTRPLRVAVRNEICKWMKNHEYEVVSDPIRYLPYWT